MPFESNGCPIGQTSSSASAQATFNCTWFETEVAPLRELLTRYLRARFAALDDPEDIAQEACIRIFRLYRSGWRVRSAKAVLYRIARNLAVDHLRRQERTPVRDITYEHACRVPVDGPSVGEAVCRHQELEILREAIGRLPPRCRQVIHLRIDCGLRIREIADRLGISEATVENQITRAFARCRAYLREKCGPEPDRRGRLGKVRDAA